MNKQTTRFSALVVSSVSALAMLGSPVAVLAAQPNANDTTTNYRTSLRELNNTGVSGNVDFTFDKGTNPSLSVHLTANGAQANKVHAIHIHGKNSPEVAK